MLITNMPNSITQIKQACNNKTDLAEPDGVERDSIREVTVELSSDKRQRIERKRSGHDISLQ